MVVSARRQSRGSLREECHVCALPVSPSSQQRPSICYNQDTGGLPLGLLQAGMNSLVITLLAGSDSENRAVCPNSSSWRYRIMQVT